MKKIEELALAMISYNNGDPKHIHHTTKVHAYASLIGACEGYLLACRSSSHISCVRRTGLSDTH